MAKGKRKKGSKAKRSKEKGSKAKGSKARKVKARAAKKPARKPAKRKTSKPAAKPKASAPADAATRALARRIIDVTLANDDEAAFALYAADVESIEAGQPAMRGIDAIRSKFAGWRNMVSSAVFEPRRICVDGNTIVIEWLGHVTMAGTGKIADLHELAIHEVRDGKIVREAFFYNPAALAP